MNETLSLLKQLFAAYPNANADEEAIVIYLQMLANVPPDALRMAIYQCIAEYKFLPGVSEILEMHRQLTGSLIEQTAGEAWGSVEKALREVGSWGTPKFRNELTGRVVQMMGWHNLCASDKPAVDRAQFMRMYEDIARRSQAVDRMLPEVRAYFETNVQRRLTESSEAGGGIRGELQRLGLLTADEQEPAP